MVRFRIWIVFNIVDQNEWNTIGMEISLRAAPASIVLFKSNCTILFIINGSNMRRMMMEESQIFRIIPRKNMVDKKKEREMKKMRGWKKNQHCKMCERCFNSPRDISNLNWYKCKWLFILCTEGVSLKGCLLLNEQNNTEHVGESPNSLIAPWNWWLLIVRWLTWSRNYVGPRGRLLFQHAILSQNGATRVRIWKQMAYCQQQQGCVLLKLKKCTRGAVSLFQPH